MGDDFLPSESAALFKNPLVTPASDIKLEWKSPDEAGVIQFLVTEKGFDLVRVQTQLKRLVNARSKASQQRIEGFFGAPAAAAAGGIVFEKPNAKRKAEEAPGSKKKGTTGLTKKAKAAGAKDVKSKGASTKKK